MSEGAERALISDYAKPRERGTAFGWYHLMVGHCGDTSGTAVRLHLAVSRCADGVLFVGGSAAVAAFLLWMWAWPVRKLDVADG